MYHRYGGDGHCILDGLFLYSEIYLVVLYRNHCPAWSGIGDSAGGAQRWIDFGGFRFQPSELAKIVLILFFARFFPKHAENLNTVKTIGLSFVLI